ncbi:MAG: hypothetical protein PHF86_02185 [Candidatus Nanoarchaeia archaeon]|nr:hypothetical protein [Candidatus Nanoarchaeia archaeon]
MNNIVEIKTKVDAIKSSDFKNFNEFWNAKRIAEKPLDDWAYSEFNKACTDLGFTTLDQLHNFVYTNDINCNKTPIEVSGIMKNSEEIKVFAILDYDYDTTICKFSVTDKKTNVSHRGAIDLGKKYLSGGIKIFIK